MPAIGAHSHKHCPSDYTISNPKEALEVPPRFSAVLGGEVRYWGGVGWGGGWSVLGGSGTPRLGREGALGKKTFYNKPPVKQQVCYE